MGIALAVIQAIVAAITAYLGVHLTLHPPGESISVKRAYKAGFIICGAISVALIAVQAYRNDRTQEALEKQLGRIENSTGRIEEHTKEPPHVTVNVPQVVVRPQSKPVPGGSLQLVKWEPFPTGGRPLGAHVHFLNTWPTPKRIAFTQASNPVLLADLKAYPGIEGAENATWEFLMDALKDHPMAPMEIPGNTPVWVQIDLPDETRQKINGGNYGAVVAIAGRDKVGTIVVEACAFLTERPDVVMLCNEHNRISQRID
jgi:hypothetical protein